MIEFSRSLDRRHPEPAEPRIPERLRQAFRNNWFDLGVVCIEVAVSVPLADRVREKAESVLDCWERVHADALKLVEVAENCEAIPLALEKEYAEWRQKYPDAPAEEYPDDSLYVRVLKLMHQMESTGIYLVQVAAAVMMFTRPTVTKQEAARIALGTPGRPQDDRVTLLVSFFNRCMEQNPRTTRKEIAEKFNAQNPNSEPVTIKDLKNAIDSRRLLAKRHLPDEAK